jgi:hypothetical protein
VKDWNLIVMTKTVDQMKILLLVKSVEELEMAVVEMAPVSGSRPSSPMKPASSLWLGLQISTRGRVFVQLSSSSGVHRSGTGSQMKMGFEYVSGSAAALRRLVIWVTSSWQRSGEQMRWNERDCRRQGVRSSAVRRFLGVRYLKERFSAESAS